MTTHRRKARRLQQAATPTTKDRAAVAQLESNPTPRLKAIGGGEGYSWNKGIGQRLGGALPGSHLPNFVEAARASLAGLKGINPTDPTEGMLASQIIAAHEAAMHLRRLAWHPDQSFVVQTRYLELAEKAARTMAMLTERLDQHRSRGQQQITVKHVTVNADQAVVADSINTGGPSGSSAPARSPGNLLTTGKQKPMKTLNGDLVEVGGEKEM
jgi:hypothetical protein